MDLVRAGITFSVWAVNSSTALGPTPKLTTARTLPKMNNIAVINSHIRMQRAYGDWRVGEAGATLHMQSLLQLC